MTETDRLKIYFNLIFDWVFFTLIFDDGGGGGMILPPLLWLVKTIEKVIVLDFLFFIVKYSLTYRGVYGLGVP